METSQEQPPLPPDRILYYQQQAQELLTRHGREFDRFVTGHERLVQAGDELLRTRQATGYNVALTEQDYPVDSSEALIFYNNYIGRPRHFGLLLAGMEQEGVISPDRVRFGAKASKTIYGGWALAEGDELLDSIKREDEDSPTQLSLTVETVVIFSPQDADHAALIVEKLSTLTDARKPGAIEGSWEIPDILATAILKRALEKSGLVEVTANILTEEEARLVTARQRTGFQNPWKAVAVEMNEELATFLTYSDVAP